MSDRRGKNSISSERLLLLQAFCDAAHGWISTGAACLPAIEKNRHNTVNRTSFAVVMNAALAAGLVSKQELTTTFSIPAAQVERGKNGFSVRVDTGIKDRFVIQMMNNVDAMLPRPLPMAA